MSGSTVYKRPPDLWPLEAEQSKPLKKQKRRLSGDEYEEVLANYWYRRPETAHDRELFVQAAMHWVVYAFLHDNSDHGKGCNHEIVEAPDTTSLIDRLFLSGDNMQVDIRCKVEMRPVCWWDVQEHYHNLREQDINKLAEDLQIPLLFEAIERLKASGFLYWHSGVWNLSATKSRTHIVQLKRRGTVFLAPEPSKLAGEYVA